MHTHRYIARFKLEADTPLFVGSGQASLLKDAMVQKDSNGMPMINGTTLAGVLRHSLEKNDWIDRIFGFAEGDKGTGSQLKVSSAYMILENDIVSVGLIPSWKPVPPGTCSFLRHRLFGKVGQPIASLRPHRMHQKDLEQERFPFRTYGLVRGFD